jgi:3-oxoacyl-[acyl-carrier protein] reductase
LQQTPRNRRLWAPVQRSTLANLDEVDRPRESRKGRGGSGLRSDLPAVARVGLVTGAATGIGRAICFELARSGVTNLVVNFHTRRSAAAQLVKDLQGRGCKAVAIRADVSNQGSVNRMMSRTIRHFGRLDFLINNAGFTKSIPIDDLVAVSDDVWNQIMDVNLRGPFYCSRSAVPFLKLTHGVITNVISVSGIRPSGSSLPYMLAKAGLVQLTRVLALALAPDVRVNAVLPGFVPTDWHNQLIGAERAAALAASVESRTPLGRLTSPEDVAGVVVALTGMGFITGQCLIVDGGRELVS